MSKILRSTLCAVVICALTTGLAFAADEAKNNNETVKVKKSFFHNEKKLEVKPEVKVDPIKNGYTDLAVNYWAAKEIDILTKNGVLVGYPDGTFKPNALVNRAEFATMVIKALVLENTPLKQITEFKDVDCSHWAYNMIERAAAFDLVKGNPNGYFYPENTVSKAEALSVTVSSLTTAQLSVDKAKQVLKRNYIDYEIIPEWFIVTAGKAEIIGLIVKVPGEDKKINADKPATRAETAVMLFNMMEQAKLNPNKKIAEAMRPKKGPGIVIPEAFVNGSVATLPAGTIVPVVLVNALSSQVNEDGEVFLGNAPDNLVTKESFILVLKGSNVSGEVIDVRPGRLFVRNGKLILDTNAINTPLGQKAKFCGRVDTTVKKNWFMKIIRAIFHGEKINLKANQIVKVKLSEPVNIDITNGWVIE